MSISMCTCDGVWSVSTMWSALAANDSARGRPTRPRPMTATLASIGGSLRAPAQVLASKRQHEARVEVEVAREQPSRLLGDPVDPLEPALLHPGGRLRDAPRVE